jgi:hypothetical protein
VPISTYTPLANITLGSSAASVTFSSITSYRDYILVYDGTLSSADYVNIQFNADTGTNYNYVNMAGYSGGAYSNSVSNNNKLGLPYAEANQRTFGQISIFDASATDKHKSTLSRVSGYDAGLSTWATAGRWASTSAITSIKIFPTTASFNTGTTFSLFGVSA